VNRVSTDPTGQVAAEGAASLYFVGTATTVIRCAGFTVLTDPNFLHRGQRAYLGFGLSSPRRTDPALTVDQLPDLDVIVLSHLHGDHWDRVARRGLDHDLPVVTTPHASRRLQRQGFTRAVGLRTWGAHTMLRGQQKLTVTAVPGQHAFGAARHLLPPVMGSVLEFGPVTGPVTGPGTTRVYLSGDTLADLVQLVDPAVVVPVHVDDYPVFRSPLSAFTDAMAVRGLADRVRTVTRGQTVDLRP